MTKLKVWSEHSTWEDAECAWDRQAKAAKEQKPNKGLNKLPNMPGISKDTAKNLKWKSLKYVALHDTGLKIIKGFLRHPLKYGWGLLRSIVKGKPYKQDEDFFLYGVKSTEEFQNLLSDPNSVLAVGFSYCHKPFECPKGRFTDECSYDTSNPACQQCFIGKCMHALPDEKSVPLVIPTIHYIGDKMFEIAHANPGKRVLFMITACEMTLEMFGDLGNMLGAQGIGVRLDGRICNTMRAFELSENGIKPGLTVVTDPTQKRMLDIIKTRREHVTKP